LPEELIEPDTKIDDVWGPWRRIVRGWAGDSKVRFEGSTGGVLTALGQFLLNSGRVKFILQIKTSVREPSFGDRTLSFNVLDVFDAAGSRYGPSALLFDIDSILERGEPFAIIGKPCDVTALRNYATIEPRVNELVKYWLAVVCGGYGTPDGTRRIIQRMGIDPASVTGVRYRGQGCPGPMRIDTAESSTEIHYLDLDYWKDETKSTVPFRCKICPDAIGEAADIVVSDTWVGGSPQREGSENDPGTNAIIARTLSGQELLEAAENTGALVLEKDIVPGDMSIYQPHQLHKKYVVGPRLQALDDEGRIVPKVTRLRINKLAAQLPDSHNQSEREGTRKRIEKGEANQPTPE
jgi:coenzyme F420 hydrogenase subunit beta